MKGIILAGATRVVNAKSARAAVMKYPPKTPKLESSEA